MRKVELLAPAGDAAKLRTALHFGADAVYLSGKSFGLHAFAENFDAESMKEAIEAVHAAGKKVYVTVNIFANNEDFSRLAEYADYLSDIKADAVIVSDPGVFALFKKRAPGTDIHVSTQANVTNKHAAAFWRDEGASRIVLARELSLREIREIADHVGDSVELETFVHGAMCISYSGRCLLSSYLTDRDGNRGECVQACRWEYDFAEKSRPELPLTLEEDGRGSYILNSRDLNTLPILDKIIGAGVSSLKIEGRMKSEYYVGCVVNAYRRRLDGIYKGEKYDESLDGELFKINHREYTTGFYEGRAGQCYATSKPHNDYRFVASVAGYDREKRLLCVEMRNRFRSGDLLELVGKRGFAAIRADEIYDEEGVRAYDCKLVCRKYFIRTDTEAERYDILRIRNGNGGEVC